VAEKGKQTVVPKLRFPEYRSASRWHEDRLDDLVTPISPPAKLQSSSYRLSGAFPIVDQSLQAICGWTDDATAVVSDALPLIVFGDHTCVLKLLRQPFAQGADGIKILKARQIISTEFLYHSLCFRPLAMEDYKRHFSIIKERKVFYPNFETGEQQKIADCLTSLDEVIAAQGRKVEALKTYKRGLMQQLFPREGEIVPRLRFPEYRDSPAWPTRDLGSMTVKVGSGITPLGGDKNYKEKGRPFVRSQNIGWGALLLNDIAYIDQKTHESFSGTEIQENDVLLNITGASIGRSAVANSRIVGGNVNQHVCIIRTNAAELNPVVLSQFLVSERGQQQIDGFQAGGNRQGLNFAQIRSFAIPVPPSESEQRRIADCLSSVDAAVGAEIAELEALRIHKKGLMQQLFPTAEEL
jgi:hypothetical protein